MQKEGKNGKKAQTTNHKTEEQHTKNILNSMNGGIHYLSSSRAKIYRYQLKLNFFHLIFQILVSKVLIPAWANHLMLL